MSGKIRTPGRAAAAQRKVVIEKLWRIHKRLAAQLSAYDTPGVTDATLKAALRSAVEMLPALVRWIGRSAQRYNRPSKRGGLGR